MTPAQAIVSLFQTAPNKIFKVFNVDEVIAGIYGTVSDAELPKTRQRMDVTLILSDYKVGFTGKLVSTVSAFCLGINHLPNLA